MNHYGYYACPLFGFYQDLIKHDIASLYQDALGWTEAR